MKNLDLILIIERISHIPIILLTAKSDQGSKLEGLEIVADDCLSKPFDSEELLIRIKNLIRLKRTPQEKYNKADFIPLERDKEKLPQHVEVNAGKMSFQNEKFMSKVMEIIERRYSEEKFNVEEFGKELYMSRMQIHRKLKAITGKSASRYIRTFRLEKAKKILTERNENISELSYSLGYGSPAYFTRCFKEEFGYPPTELKMKPINNTL